MTAATLPTSVLYCHCSDCKRWTGAPLPAFACFADDELSLSPDQDAGNSLAPGVTRWNCAKCGSPLMARFDYLPNQSYVPLGILDQAEDLPPQLHAHAQSEHSWLHLNDGLDRIAASSRDVLNQRSST